MKKLVMLSLCLLATTGCGRGWFPRLFRGAPCMGGCPVGGPIGIPAGNCAPCTGVETGAGYESYPDSGEPIVGGGYPTIGESYIGGQVMEGGIVDSGSYNSAVGGGAVTSPQSMQPLPSSTPARP